MEKQDTKSISELYDIINNGYLGEGCALSKEEWQLEKLVDAVREEESGLLAIGILKRGFKWIHENKSGISLSESIDEHIGKIGTPERDKFETELDEELSRTKMLVSINKIREAQLKGWNKKR